MTKEVHESMGGDVYEVMLKTRAIKAKLEELDASTQACRRVARCGHHWR